MCKDGKCVNQTRNAAISLGTAARELAKISEHPQMVVKASSHIAILPANPMVYGMPDFVVVMEVYPTTDDADIARKADRYMIESTRRKPAIIKVLEGLFGLPPTPDDSDETKNPTSVA